MRINTNVNSLAAQEAGKNTNKTIQGSLEKLSTGLKINKSADDASGLAIADKLRTQVTSINQGLANGSSAVALIQIADKAMAEQSNILDTVKSKLIQAGTATTTDAGREAIRKDITKLLEQFDNIAAQTNYNGITLLQQNATTTTVQSTLTFQMGEDYSFDVSLTASKASNTASLGGGSDSISDATLMEGGDTLFVKNTANVQMNYHTIASDGSLSTASAALDLQMSGDLATFTNSGNGNVTIDMDNEVEINQDLMKTMAANYSLASYNATTNTLTINSGGAVDMSEMDLSSVQVQSTATDSSASITVSASTSGFSVKNNETNALGMNHLELNGGGTMTGGELLSSIKDLAVDGLTNAKANSFMATIDESITQLNTIRADFGSSQNQIESSIRNMQTTATNIQAAESVIRDVDYAAESASFNKQNIIAQAGTYAMSQANAVQQNVLRLLQ